MKRILYIIIGIFFLASCAKVDYNDPRGSTEVPDMVTVTNVKNISGASIIYYDRPDDKNLKYVRAVYTTDDGITMDATASFYTDSILIEGFGSEGTYTVYLYSISAGEASSEPVEVTINPLTPPYLSAYEKLELFPTFAGIRVSSQNETAAKLSIGMYKKNEKEEWEEINMYYTVNPKISYSVRGQDTILAEFGVKIRDKWGHWSEMKTIETIPWYEELCNKSLFQEVTNLPSDTREMHSWGSTYPQFKQLYDGKILRSNSECFHTRPNVAPLPQHFTLDLGKVYTLSRILVWGRCTSTDMGAGSNDWNYVWTSGHPQRIQLYGSTITDDAGSLPDDLNDPSWVLLVDDYLFRADGSLDPVTGNNYGTAEDKALLERGHEFEFPADAPKVRFFRFRTMMTYGGTSGVMMSEISLYGSDK